MRFQFERGVIPSQIKVLFAFKCAECGAEFTQESLGESVLYPEWPAGWASAGPYVWICPKHYVTIKITDKVLSEAAD